MVSMNLWQPPQVGWASRRSACTRRGRLAEAAFSMSMEESVGGEGTSPHSSSSRMYLPRKISGW